MEVLLVLIAVSALASICLVPLAKRLSHTLGALDCPACRRKVHNGPIPRLGGIAVFVPVCAVMASLPWLPLGGHLRLDRFQWLAILTGSLAIFLLGLYDDTKGASAAKKLAVQFSVATAAYVAGLRVTEVSIPLGWTIDLGILGFAITLLWIVGIMNAVNLLDGEDGVAAGVSAIGALAILVVAFPAGTQEVALLAAVLIGSLLGFLLFNFNPASVFLGDCGALFIGFLLAAVSIVGKGAVPLLIPIVILGLPIFDTLLALVRRTVRGKHLFQPDREHVHHRLLARGLSPRQVALTLYGVSALLGIVAILLASAGRMTTFLTLGFLAVAVALTIRHLKPAEFRELLGVFRHGERRRRPPRVRTIMVRNTLPQLGRAENLQQLRRLLDQVRETLDLSTLRLRLMTQVFPGAPEGAADLVLPVPGFERIAGSQLPVDMEWLHSVDVFCHLDYSQSGQRNGHCSLLDNCPIANDECGVGRRRVVAEVVATKSAWKRRRKSENDEELLQMLADGLGDWLAGQMPAWITARPRIVVADDDPKILQLVGSTFGDSYDVVEAWDGAEAIAKVREVDPELLLLDLRMSRVDGYTVCQALKADRMTQKTPIIVLTTLGDTAAKIRGLALGADDYLAKPFDGDELKALVQVVLRRTNA